MASGVVSGGGRSRYWTACDSLVTDRDAARRAGRYQAEWAGRDRTIHTADALVAGTVRAHGALLLTHNTGDLPMRDLRVRHPDTLGAIAGGSLSPFALPRMAVYTRPFRAEKGLRNLVRGVAFFVGVG